MQKPKVLNSRRSRNHGFTIVELLASSVITIFLMSGVVIVLSNSMHAGGFLENNSDLQSNGQYALNIMAEDVRMAGFTGCAAYDVDPRFDEDFADRFIMVYNGGLGGNVMQTSRGIQGWEANNTAPGEEVPIVYTATVNGTTPTGWNTTDANQLSQAYAAIPSADIIKVWTVESGSDSAVVTDIAVADGSVQVTLEETDAFAANDIVVFSDCKRTMVMQACNVVSGSGETVLTADASCSPGNLITVDTGRITSLNAGSSVYSMREVTYFVSKRDAGATTLPSLFRDTGDGPVEVLEGVESIQVLYGENTDFTDGRKSVDAYVTAGEVADWNRVLSAKISILMQGHDDRIAPEGFTYAYNYVAAVDPTDQRLRRAYSTTVALRNRTILGYNY